VSRRTATTAFPTTGATLIAPPAAVTGHAVVGSVQIGFDRKQRVDETLLLVGGEPGQSRPAHIGSCGTHGLEGRHDLLGEKHSLGTPVGRVGLATHPSFRLQAIEQPSEGGFFDLEQVGEVGLRHPVVAEQVVEYPSLRTREPQRLDAPVEGRA
jgi:hypothetical protein